MPACAATAMRARLRATTLGHPEYSNRPTAHVVMLSPPIPVTSERACSQTRWMAVAKDPTG